MNYRREIDGLRALAVLPVILFHAGFETFSGGFVGVDLFFVISGYLITTILIEDMQSDSFSFVNFYERRARRILPALFLVMFICIPFAWMWMLPNQLKDFLQSLVAVSLFFSNILFWRESGYFEAEAEEKPLLHTWSLAVEEQYYLFFPIFLFFAWRYGKSKVFWMVVFFAAVSLVLSEIGWRYKPNPNFYLAPTRAWELLSGSIAAFIVLKRGVQSNNGLSFVGLSAIALSIITYDQTIPFPSLYALLPVLGAVLLILYGDQATFVGKLLSKNFFVGIGLISYSAYLWHQPLLAFAKLRLIEGVTSGVALFLVLITIFLAAITWRYVELPFRKKKSECFNDYSIFYFFALMAIVPLILLSMALINDSWLVSRKISGNKSFSDYGYVTEAHEEIGFSYCEGFNLAKVCGHDVNTNAIAWGDSYVKHGIPFVATYEKWNIGQLALASCTPFIGGLEESTARRSKYEIDKCADFNREVAIYIKQNVNIDYLILGSRFSLLQDKTEEQVIELANRFDSELKRFISEVNRPIEVVLFPPPPTPNFDPSKCVAVSLVGGSATSKCDFLDGDFSKIYSKQKLFVNTLRNSDIKIYPIEKLMCKEGVCRSLIGNLRIYRDNGHLRNESSKELGRQLYATENR